MRGYIYLFKLKMGSVWCVKSECKDFVFVNFSL